MFVSSQSFVSYRNMLRNVSEDRRPQSALTQYYTNGHVKFNVKYLLYRGADKSLARPGRKQATATEDFEFHISYICVGLRPLACCNRGFESHRGHGCCLLWVLCVAR